MPLIQSIRRLLHLAPKQDKAFIIRNIAYCSDINAHGRNKLDIFLPFPKPDTSDESDETNKKQLPVIVHVHGGGWTRGSRSDEQRGGPSVGRACAYEGFVGVVLSYRLARISLLSFLTWSFAFGLPIIIIGIGLLSWQLITGYIAFMTLVYAYNALYRVRVPVTIEHMMDDLCRALVYVHDHINHYCPQADPNQIFISGHSAGAHLASLLVLNKTYLHRYEFPLLRIRGVIVMSGIYSLANPMHDSERNIRNLIFRLLYSSNLIYSKGTNMLEYSPIEYIMQNEHIPPFLVMSARFDMGLQVDAKRFVEKLSASQHSVNYYTINAGHGSISNNFENNDARKQFFTFIRQHMNY